MGEGGFVPYKIQKHNFEMTVDPKGPPSVPTLGVREVTNPIFSQKVKMENKHHTLDFSCPKTDNSILIFHQIYILADTGL